MAAIPPRTNIEGLQRAAGDLIQGAFSRGMKYGRYLEQQEQICRKQEKEAENNKIEVVFCKDCDAYGASPFGHPYIGWCMIEGEHRPQEHYCAYGKRRME